MEFDDFEDSVVVEFARYRSWGDELERGMRLLSKEPRTNGYIFRVSLHKAKLYEVSTLCKGLTSSWPHTYTLALMSGQEDWALEVVLNRGSSLTIALPRFNPRVSLKGYGQITLWDHLGAEL